MRFLTRAILIVAAVTLAAAASAQGPRPGGGPKPGGGGGGGTPGGTITGFNPDQIAQLFNSAGFKSQVVENNKAKMVQTLFWSDANDIFSGAFGIYCNDKGQCGGMTTFANLGKVEAADAAWLNAWNSRYYFVRAYVTKEGNLIFDWDTLLVNVSPDDIVLTAKLFKQIVDQSSDFKP
jgi:Putative bacterial sensory transduction regulator